MLLGKGVAQKTTMILKIYLAVFAISLE